ncbi:uncharacterized protein [Chelonus insularis]|uniref:uncharacterized protein isoform X2 n=1 Tax=Chelonus insularis TaxID=460826 RepID=UPI00158BE6BA|nr:uncharacterized protein LOC118073005 isoform X2 [Chelonus insularis]
MNLDLKMMSKLLESLLCLSFIVNIKSAIVPPPWANPSSNPCAVQPRGWQLLYWPADGKCYKIFQIGAPCPESMELGPAAKGGGTIAECRCPPGTAQSRKDSLCYPIFTKASCPSGQYFAPISDSNTNRSTGRWGICKEPEKCSEHTQVFWPRDEKCYTKLTRGPCPKGQLLTLNKDNLAECQCSSTDKELGLYYYPDNKGGCYEHYTKGPCSEPGEIFLPGGTCGCQQDIPHYHSSTKMCYPLGEIGPCLKGHHFVVTNKSMSENRIFATCTCKPDHILYKDGLCYRKYTRGPCETGYMIINSTNCIPVPCKRRRLFFPQEKTCYKIGSKGPCPSGQIVLYDRNVRPSIDGVSYNGVCGCTETLKLAGKCSENTDFNDTCENTPGMFLLNKTCYKLYTQGPCGLGEWLVPRRQSKTQEIFQDTNKSKIRCECRPGYRKITRASELIDIEINTLTNFSQCQPPAVSLAEFLNKNFKNSDFEV